MAIFSGSDKASILGLTTIMFGLAPDADIYSDLVASYEAHGNNLFGLAGDLEATGAFQARIDGKNNDQIADYLLENLDLDPASTAGQAAHDYFVDRLSDGASVGDIASEAVLYLLDDNRRRPAFDDAAETLRNKIEVASYFIDSGFDAQHLSDLNVIDEVITDLDVAAAKNAIDVLAQGHEPFKLSTGFDLAGRDASDDVSGKYDNLIDLTMLDDVIDGTTPGSLQVGDKIVDPSVKDNDTLEAVLTGDLGVNDPNGDSLGAPNDLDDPNISGPVIQNIESITFRDDDAVSVINLDGVKNNKDMYIDSEDAAQFNSLHDLQLLEIANLDGNQVGKLHAIDRTQNLAVSDIRNDAEIVLKSDFKNLLVDAYAEDGQDDAVTIDMKGASFNLGLFDDDDGKSPDDNDGGQFKTMTLVSEDAASVVTLMDDTTLNNATDDTSNTTGAADKADADTDKTGTDDTGTEGSMQTLEKNDGVDNSLLAETLYLDGDQDITLVGTGIQFDEAIIKENNDDALTSTIDLTLQGEAEVSAPVDLTWAQVDRVVVKALGATDHATDWMEIDVDQDSIVRVDAIEDLDALVITGDHQYDDLEIEINTGAHGAPLGRLVLGGDASATTTDFDADQGNAVGGTEAHGNAGNVSPDLTTPDARSATLTVVSDSYLGALDISQISGPKVTIKGSEDLRIYELIMGNGGPGDGDTQANTIDAREMTGDFTAELAALNTKVNNLDSLTPDQAHDDGNGIDDNAAAGTFNGGNADNGAGVTILLGSGNDELDNVGVLGTKDGEWDHTDNIDMGDGNDVVQIGSFDPDGNRNDDAVGAEIYGGQGKDTFIFTSVASTDKGQLAAGTQYTFADAGSTTSDAPVAQDKHASDQTGVSLIQIEDFNSGMGAAENDNIDADQISFNLFRDVDGNTSTTTKDTAANPELFHNGEVLDATSDARYLLSDGDVVLVKVADIDAVTAETVKGFFGDTVAGTPTANADDMVTAAPDATATPAALFEDPDVEADSMSDFQENIIIVGEADGSDGVKIFYVREGGNVAPDTTSATCAVDNLEVTLIGQLNGTDENELNINRLTIDNFDFA